MNKTKPAHFLIEDTSLMRGYVIKTGLYEVPGKIRGNSLHVNTAEC